MFYGPNGSGKGRTNESSKLSPIDKRRRRHAIRNPLERRRIAILRNEVLYEDEDWFRPFRKSRLDHTLVARRTDSDLVDSVLDSRLYMRVVGPTRRPANVVLSRILQEDAARSE